MDVKFCRGCKKERAVEDFRWREKAKGTRNSKCFECKNAQGKSRYHSDLEASRKMTLDRYYRNRVLSEKTLLLKNPPVGFKWCGSHQMFHPVSEFYPDRSTKDCLEGWCKKARYKSQRATYLKYQERYDERKRNWTINNKDKRREYERRSKLKLKLLDPEKFRVKNIIYSRRIRTATPAWVDKKEIERIYRMCPEHLTVDHYVAIKGVYEKKHIVCGLHVPWNLEYLTRPENCRKNNHFDPQDPKLLPEELRIYKEIHLK